MGGVGSTRAGDPLPIRVFQLDDSPDETTLLRYLLADCDGMEHVGCVNDPGALLPALRDARPDVLILDYSLGDHVRFEDIVRDVRRERPDLAVVCLTGCTDPESAATIRASALEGWVIKTSPLETLLAAIRGAGGRPISANV